VKKYVYIKTKYKNMQIVEKILEVIIEKTLLNIAKNKYKFIIR